MTAPCVTTGTYAYDLQVRVLWLETLAAPDAPTFDELAAGVDLLATHGLSDIAGWLPETAAPPRGRWGPFDRQRLGRRSVSDAVMVFPASLDGQDVRQLLTRGDAGWVVFCPAGDPADYPDQLVDVFPVAVREAVHVHALRTGRGAEINVTFAITSWPYTNTSIAGT